MKPTTPNSESPNRMNIKYNLNRSDFVLGQFSASLRNQKLYIIILAIFILGPVRELISSQEITNTGVMVILFSTIVTLCFVPCLLLFIGFLMSYTKGLKTGIIGQHELIFSKKELIVITPYTQTAIGWEAISKIYNTSRTLIIKISGIRFIYIPCKDLKDKDEILNFVIKQIGRYH